MFKAIQIEMVSAPNFYVPIPESGWAVTDPNAVTLWFQLMISDSLGERRYVPASGSSMTVAFQRADAFASNQGKLTQSAQTLSLPATMNANDRSLMSLSLTSQNVQSVVSGSVKFTLVEGSATTSWVQSHFLSKKMTVPGF